MNEFNSLLEEFDLKESTDQFNRGRMATLKESPNVLTGKKKRFDITEAGHDLLVPINSTVILEDGIAPRVISTTSIDEYKLWIGRSNELADDYAWEMPSKAWGHKSFKSKEELTKKEVSDIEKSGWIYIFNDSNKVASYSKAIESYHGNFEASLYHIRRLVIQPGGRLLVKGGPSILLIDEMEIQGDGQMETYTICHATIGSFRKTEQNKFINN